MSEQDAAATFKNAEQVNAAFRSVSDFLNGAVSTLTGEGWTEAQAREIVVAQWVTGLYAQVAK